MRYAIVENQRVINVTVADLPLEPNWHQSDEAQIGWLFDGQFSSPPPPIKSDETIRAEIEGEVQLRLDNFARTRGYDNIVSACSYATSSSERYGVEGRYCVLAREQTWDTLFAIESEVLMGTRPMPTDYNQIEPELPMLVWPT